MLCYSSQQLLKKRRTLFSFADLTMIPNQQKKTVKMEKSGASLAVMQHGDRLLASSVVARMVLQLVQFCQHAAVHSEVDDYDDRYGTNEVYPFVTGHEYTVYFVVQKFLPVFRVLIPSSGS
jgi:hypothetical protein